jgi:hypothetical protein
MFRLLHSVLLCLLVLALPVQGVAAATMQFCAAAHRFQSMAADAAAEHKAVGHVHADATAEADAQFAAQSCSACAACCAASAPPAAPFEVPRVEPLVEPAAVAASIYSGPCGSGLERPPKSPLG